MNRLIRFTALALLLLAAAPVWAAPHFSGADLQGRQHSLADYRGKMVVVNFWATWCPPCREELPELAIFHDNHKDKDGVVLGVNFEAIDRDRLQSFVEEQMIDYPVLPMAPSAGSSLGRIVALPTSYIISPDQSQVRVHVGPLTTEDLERYLNSFD